MKVTIRNMCPEDYPDLVRFLQDLHRSHHGARPDIFREQGAIPSEELYLCWLQSRDRLYLCAEAEGKTVGFCDTVLQSVSPDSPLLPVITAHINDLYVLPEFRRNGIATALFRETERRSREAGAEKIGLMVWSFNEEAVAFYRKLGMEPVVQRMEIKL